MSEYRRFISAMEASGSSPVAGIYPRTIQLRRAEQRLQAWSDPSGTVVLIFLFQGRPQRGARCD